MKGGLGLDVERGMWLRRVRCFGGGVGVRVGGGGGVRGGAACGWRGAIWMSSQSGGALTSKENLWADGGGVAVGVGGDCGGDVRSMKLYSGSWTEIVSVGMERDLPVRGL